MSALVLYCSHEWSKTGAEGPIAERGRFPILWSCDVCGWLTLDEL